MKKTGTIKSFDTRGSIGLLILEDMGQTPRRVLCESNPTTRAFISAFGSVEKAIGQTITYELDDLGIMKSFEVADE